MTHLPNPSSLHDLDAIRAAMRADRLAPDADILARLPSLPRAQRQAISDRAEQLVTQIRAADDPGLMEVFLAEYGLSTDEGVALMCLAEALLRVPDAQTMDALIEDKIAPSDWGKHLGKSSSSLVNASTWALMLTGKVLQEEEQGIAARLKGAVKRLGEPVIRTAVGRAMREMGAQFVLGETIEAAIKRGAPRVEEGYSYSYDMLGEAAMTAADARDFMQAYAHAIKALRAACTSTDIRDNPGISIKLSALHPRYELAQKTRIMQELVPRVLELARAAKAAGMGLNIDAEEAGRLDLSLDVIEAVLRDPDLAGWDGFGVVVQAYGKRAAPVLDWLYALSTQLDRKVMVRLVKGAYWDTEIKRAQELGLPGFPVFSTKAATDVSYIACAQKLFSMTDRIYPQFATHNAHTVAAVLDLATDSSSFEFQRLHGMGETLHALVHAQAGTRCRIYAPVGAHRDLLAYLVRRLLENGANSSFVNQIVDTDVPASDIVIDPLDSWTGAPCNPAVTAPGDLFAPERANSKGWDLENEVDVAAIQAARAPWADHEWQAEPLLACTPALQERWDVTNPYHPGEAVGQVHVASAEDCARALDAAQPWAAEAEARQISLMRAADLYEACYGELFALLTREAGKTPLDAIAEMREAVDFLRYYAAQGRNVTAAPRGIFTCISPWNFPLAIFTGQIAAALAAGNAVLAKPAEPTNLVAYRAVQLLHEAGVPRSALQLLPGTGAEVGHALTSDARVTGVCFTGSTATAQTIHKTMAQHLAPNAPLIAETGGLNAMIVDSTALPEQAIRDIVTSAFQSAGQRCSALRMLYVQKDVEGPVLEMLKGAMDELALGHPWDVRTDVGPLISAQAQHDIAAYVAAARTEGRVIHDVPAPETGYFVAPTVLNVDGIGNLTHEVFGPILHVATYDAADLSKIVRDINAAGYGLTFGMHSRIDDRIEEVSRAIDVGNLYINRNQIGAIVGSQPFGGHGLSGTGPKAGGPSYVPRFCAAPSGPFAPLSAVEISYDAAQARVNATPQPAHETLSRSALPGPTGESNVLSRVARGVVLCLGPGPDAASAQAAIARGAGCTATEVPEALDPAALAHMTGFEAIAFWGPHEHASAIRVALAARTGPILPLLTEADFSPICVLEKHVCIDTTAAGGNASLLAASS